MPNCNTNDQCTSMVSSISVEESLAGLDRSGRRVGMRPKPGCRQALLGLQKRSCSWAYVQRPPRCLISACARLSPIATQRLLRQHLQDSPRRRSSWDPRELRETLARTFPIFSSGTRRDKFRTQRRQASGKRFETVYSVQADTR